MPKASTVAIYASIFALIVAIVAIGYRPPQETGGVANASPVVNDTQSQTTAVDEVVATTIAANLAQSTNLSIAPDVANFAVSAKVKSELAQADNETILTKPQLIQTGAENRSVIKYTVKEGDTVDSIASANGISAETLKWANNLTTNTLAEGKTVAILPVDGVLYTVKTGDTIESISEKYDVDQTRVVLYNDLEVSGIKVGQKLILPGANLPNNERPGYVAPVTYNTTNFALGGGGSNVKFLYRNTKSTSGGNTSQYGYCTWYAWERRAAIGKPLPGGTTLGDAVAWARSLGSRGYTVVYGVPRVGAVMQNGGGYSGHVAVVENIAENGDVTVSEMNYIGWNNVSQRTITAGQAKNYNFIY